MKNKSPLNFAVLGFWMVLFAAFGSASVFVVSHTVGQTDVGQMPPGKLTRQESIRSNPLRTDLPMSLPGNIQQTAASQQNEHYGEGYPPIDTRPFEPSGFDSSGFPGTEIPDTFPGDRPLHHSSDSSVGSGSDSAIPSTHSPLSRANPFARPASDAAGSDTVGPPDFSSHGLQNHGLQNPGAAGHHANGSFHVAQSPKASQGRQADGTGLPGAVSLEGMQTPHLTIQKILPEEVVIDQPATLKTVIQNVGNSTAKNVIIIDRVPQGTQLISTVPDAVVAPDGELRWAVGNLDPNVQLEIEMKVLPVREGDIGSVAAITYTGEVSARVAVTRPMLKVEINAPAEVKFGETAHIEIIVSNPGTATVHNIVLENRVPEGLFHNIGRVIRNDQISALKPKETRKLTLPLICTGSGNLVNHVVVTADGNLTAEDKATIRALAPVLELEIAGARTRFLERRAEYRLIVSNNGNAPAHDVALELALPASVQFVSTNQSGMYESSTHSVHWALAELPAREAGEIALTVMPMEKGEAALRFTGLGENNLTADTSLPISIDGIPAITFDIVGDSNLVELGKEVIYEIRLANRGTKAAENVRVRVALPEGMPFVKAEGGRSQAAQGGIVQFETLTQLEAKDEHIYRVSVRSQQEGDHRVNVQVISDDLRSPITKEESTRVFR